jgi:hypothetical protein
MSPLPPPDEDLIIATSRLIEALHLYLSAPSQSSSENFRNSNLNAAENFRHGKPFSCHFSKLLGGAGREFQFPPDPDFDSLNLTFLPSILQSQPKSPELIALSHSIHLKMRPVSTVILFLALIETPNPTQRCQDSNSPAILDGLLKMHDTFASHITSSKKREADITYKWKREAKRAQDAIAALKTSETNRDNTWKRQESLIAQALKVVIYLYDNPCFDQVDAVEVGMHKGSGTRLMRHYLAPCPLGSHL